MVNQRHIQQAHQRDRREGIEHDMLFPRLTISGPELEQLRAEHSTLIEVAQRLMQRLHAMVHGSGFMFMLTDRQGCILHMLGDTEQMKDARALGIAPGAYLSERSVGTNAIGMAISDRQPVQLTAEEHFINSFRRWTCSAAPIMSHSGEVLGTLSLMGRHRLVHQHTLGMVVAAVHSVEQELLHRAATDALQAALDDLDAVIESAPMALLTANSQGYVARTNQPMCALLGVRPQELMGRPLDGLIKGRPDLWDDLHAGRRVADEEVDVRGVPQRGRFLLTASPITASPEGTRGMVFALRSINRVYRIVNRYTGMCAYHSFSDIIGQSAPLRRAVEFAQQVASSPSTVLITGESGTGKEVFAQAMHNASNRHDASFVAVNCGAIPETLFESELFGYEDGAFTGARKGGRPGRFELANGGTLFLDEVGELPLDMQVKLLRALQEGCITRVGGQRSIPIDVRIIAATNRDLKQRVEEGAFRQDLYYRLSVIPLRIPPLRERKEDIPLLVRYFLHSKAQKLHKDVPPLDDDTHQLLLRYEWPGNVRELENFIEKTVNLDGRILLDVKDEAEFRRRYLSPAAIATPATPPPPDAPCAPAPTTLAELERCAIDRAVETCPSMAAAAKALGISRNTLYLKCRAYGISPKSKR